MEKNPIVMTIIPGCTACNTACKYGSEKNAALWVVANPFDALYSCNSYRKETGSVTPPKKKSVKKVAEVVVIATPEHVTRLVA